ncbi:MAG: hypothetical protein OXR71_08920 [Gemmatimonadota bacterium]|nr:hypothetical protein [Gemmatimonadota bacterium]
MQLTPEQIREFYDRGYVKIPGAISKAMVDTARQAVNHSIGTLGPNGEDMSKHRAAQFCRDLNGAPVIMDLFNASPVISLAESLMGEGNLQKPIRGAQVAPRFPTVIGEVPPEPRGHLDGMGTGTNGMPKGVYRRGFTAFAVIYLADVPEPYSGNFTVWPQSHRFFENYFKREGLETLSNGTPRVDLPEGPDMVTGNAGDLIIAHHQMIHTGGPNASPNIRYAAIARLRHIDCDKNGNEGFQDIWREFPCVREAIAA